MKNSRVITFNSILNRMLLFCFGLLVFSSCMKKEDEFDEAGQMAIDENTIKEYIAANNLTATRSASGLYYSIAEPGEGAELKVGDVVAVHYRGTLLDGTSFDNSYANGYPLAFRLGVDRLIPGFEEGIALLKKGGSATLLIPSALAYGREGNSTIPANSVLRFDVEVLGPNTDKELDNSIIRDYLSAQEITSAIQTDSGLFFVPIEAGTGAQATIGDEVAVHYRGKFLNGRVFDESSPSSPMILTLGDGEMTKGFDEGVSRMKVGEKATLLIPAHLGYGALGSPAPRPPATRVLAIPPYAVLLFEVELVAINK